MLQKSFYCYFMLTIQQKKDSLTILQYDPLVNTSSCIKNEQYIHLSHYYAYLHIVNVISIKLYLIHC